MKYLLDNSPIPIEVLIPAILIVALISYVVVKVNQIRSKHISTKRLDPKTILQLLRSKKNKKATWEKFKKCEGLFEDHNKLDESYGGGISGSW